jgi:uncharacterized protein YjbK
MFEYEKKVMLSEKEYRFLMKHRSEASRSSVHINHYYDTDGFEMDKQGITCRIREANGVFTATVKEHGRQEKDCSMETSRKVKNQYDDCLFQNKNITYQGFLKTTRMALASRPGISTMLDRNDYLGTVDYELEIEYVPDKEKLAMKELNQLVTDLEKNGIVSDSKEFKIRTGRGKSKSARFFDRKRKLEAEERRHS